MSIKLMSAIWERTELSQSETLVALAIADHANDNGLCWPSIKTIAKKSRIKRRAVQYVLQALEAKGILAIERSKGAGRTSRYRLTLDKGAFNAPPDDERCNPRQERCTQVRGRVQPGAPESSLTSKEPKTVYTEEEVKQIRERLSRYGKSFGRGN